MMKGFETIFFEQSPKYVKAFPLEKTLVAIITVFRYVESYSRKAELGFFCVAQKFLLTIQTTKFLCLPISESYGKTVFSLT